MSRNGTVLTAESSKVTVRKAGSRTEVKIEGTEKLVILKEIAETWDIPQFRAETDTGHEITKTELNRTFRSMRIREVVINPIIQATGAC